MIVHETSPNTFAEVTGDLAIGDNVEPWGNFAVWGDADLALRNCYRVDFPATPAGKLMTKYTVARIDGVVQITCEYEDRPPTPPPPPGPLSKRVLIERLNAEGLLAAAFHVLGGPGALGYERWQASTYVDTTNPEVRGLLSAIGGNLNSLLSPET